MKTVLILFIRIYQLGVAPWLRPGCRFYPSCSQYAIEAVEARGAVRGAFMALRRLLRCHPFGGHGIDFVKQEK